MDRLTALAAGGMRARSESLDLLANNLANSTTAGFKVDRDAYARYLSEDASGAEPEMPTIEREWTDFSQGPLKTTGNSLDLALEGKAFFTVRDAAGATLYTRTGSFQVGRNGELATAEGHRVLGREGKPIQIDPALPLEIDRQGVIRQGGNEVNQIQLADFPSTDPLRKRGAGYFQWLDPKQTPAPAQSTDVRQGALEAPNSSAPENAARLITILRQFESLQRALTIGGEMNRRSVEEVARVNS